MAVNDYSAAEAPSRGPRCRYRRSATRLRRRGPPRPPRLPVGDRGTRGLAGSPSAAGPGAMTASPKRRWRPAARGQLLMPRCCGSPRGVGRRRQVDADRRLLFETKSIFEDQLESIERTSEKARRRATDLALLTDACGPSAEQGITIDVAHRISRARSASRDRRHARPHPVHRTWSPAPRPRTWRCCWSTPARRARTDPRHALLSSLLRCLPRLCVNKMDLSTTTRRSTTRSTRVRLVRGQARDHRPRLRADPALDGDNVVTRSPNMPCSKASRCSANLEEVHIASDRNLVDTAPGPVRDPAAALRAARLRGFAARWSAESQAGRRGDGAALETDLEDRRDRHPLGARSPKPFRRWR